MKDMEDAKTEADRIRSEIREGTFARAVDRRTAALAVPATPDAVNLEKFASTYVDRVSQIRERNKSWTNDKHMFARLAAFRLEDGTRLGDKALGAITEDDLETFLAALRASGRAASTRNQYVQLVKASFRWAVKKGYVTRSPISEDSTLKRAKIAQRSRRLAPDVLDEKGSTHRRR
jgi:integrase